MVEYKELNLVFQSLADPTRRDILKRVAKKRLSIQEIAHAYQKYMSLAAVSKHVQVLERSKLVNKKRAGKRYFVEASPPHLGHALDYLRQYEKIWEQRLDRLENHLKNKLEKNNK
jgi:DNA-binding transcriptional ArsR family regulator